MPKKKNLRWKKDPAETGLRAVCVDSKKRPSTLHDGVTEYASVYANDYHYSNRKKPGWYWVASGPVPYKNTCDELLATEEAAKDAAMDYVKQHLAKQEQP